MNPIQKTTHVPLAPSAAFNLFITQIDTWWPKDTQKPFSPKGRLVVSPGPDGAINDVAPDGSEAPWGRIILWEPGRHLVMSWFPNGEEDAAMVVSVTFTETSQGTRVDLTHSPCAVSWPTADAVSRSYLLGWDLVLGSYCFAAARVPVMA